MEIIEGIALDVKRCQIQWFNLWIILYCFVASSQSLQAFRKQNMLISQVMAGKITSLFCKRDRLLVQSLFIEAVNTL